MDNDKIFPFVLVVIFMLVTSFLLVREGVYDKSKTERINYVKIGGAVVKVDLALTQGEREQGLSGRSGLPENEGMLFIFDTPGKYDFWMKDMNFAVDIIWLSDDKKIVYIKHDARPEAYLKTYGPERDAKYVLEVNSGFTAESNIKEGDGVIFTY